MSDTFHLCPDCGQDMEYDYDVGVYWCDNCHEAWQECEVKPTCVEYFNEKEGESNERE